MNEPQLVVVAVVGGGLIGFLPYFIESAVPALRRRALDRALTQSELEVDSETRGLIGQFMRRRALWGAYGGGLGGLCSGLLAIWIRHLSDGDAGPLFVVLILAGPLLGQALASATTPELSGNAPRLTSLQPRGFFDYLQPGEVIAEVAALALGLAIAASGSAMLVGFGVDAEQGAGWVELSVGLFIATVCVVALLLQRRLLHAPRPADADAALVANDFVLATGLRDLLIAVLGTTLSACYGATVLVGSPAAIPLGAITFGLFVASLILTPRRRPALTPVARQVLQEAASRTPPPEEAHRIKRLPSDLAVSPWQRLS